MFDQSSLFAVYFIRLIDKKSLITKLVYKKSIVPENVWSEQFARSVSYQIGR